MMKIPNREVAQAARDARRQGWTVEPTSRHVVFINPRGERYIAARTPSDYRGTRNMMAALRRLGLVDHRRPPQPKTRRTA